jgi:hypothetical protein
MQICAAVRALVITECVPFSVAVCREGWWQEDGSQIRPGQVSSLPAPDFHFGEYCSVIMFLFGENIADCSFCCCTYFRNNIVCSSP